MIPQFPQGGMALIADRRHRQPLARKSGDFVRNETERQRPGRQVWGHLILDQNGLYSPAVRSSVCRRSPDLRQGRSDPRIASSQSAGPANAWCPGRSDRARNLMIGHPSAKAYSGRAGLQHDGPSRVSNPLLEVLRYSNVRGFVGRVRGEYILAPEECHEPTDFDHRGRRCVAGRRGRGDPAARAAGGAGRDLDQRQDHHGRRALFDRAGGGGSRRPHRGGRHQPGYRTARWAEHPADRPRGDGPSLPDSSTTTCTCCARDDLAVGSPPRRRGVPQEGARDAAHKAAAVGAGEWVYTLGGWAMEQFADDKRPFTRDELDQAVPNNPVFLQASYREAYLNSKGLQAMAISETRLRMPRSSATPPGSPRAGFWKRGFARWSASSPRREGPRSRPARS